MAYFKEMYSLDRSFYSFPAQPGCSNAIRGYPCVLFFGITPTLVTLKKFHWDHLFNDLTISNSSICNALNSLNAARGRNFGFISFRKTIFQKLFDKHFFQVSSLRQIRNNEFESITIWPKYFSERWWMQPWRNRRLADCSTREKYF